MNFLNIFSNCLLVKGHSMSLICDLQRREYHHIPNDLYEVINTLKEKSIEECYEYFGKGNKTTIKSYIKFIVDNDLGFVDTQIIPELVPINLQWDTYSPITNLIIELDENSDFNTDFFLELLKLNIDAVEIRSYNAISEELLNSVLNIFQSTTIYNIKIALKFSNWMNKKTLSKICQDNMTISTFIVHSSPKEKIYKIMKDSTVLFFSETNLDSERCCGNIHPKYFITNVELFTESQEHNTCLNRKLAIDVNGNIKNCPSMQENFGNIKTASLKKVLENSDLKKYWFINKDKISVCQDCEFRHVCTDCRAYIENPEDLYSKPLKCGYDPYANVWEDWTINPFKQSTIAYYNLENLIA